MKRLVASLIVLCTASCLPVKDVNKVGSSYIDKAMFDGEWRYRSAIVDKAYSQASTFIGSQCDLERVKFEITEDKLIAYRSYEKVGGTETANAGKQTWLAAFPITKHFDIKRRYNSQNGVEDNVIIENDFDKPWADRKYIRVDWSKNLVPDTQCNDFIRTQTVQQIARNSFADDIEPFHVRVSPTYIDTTTDALSKPDQKVCSYIGDWNCAGSRVRLKSAFWKISDQSTYEPMAYPDYRTVEYGFTPNRQLCLKGDPGCSNLKELWLARTPMGTQVCDPSIHNPEDCEQFEVPVFSRFGFFRTERQSYDRERGFTAQNREQLINRWNIWEQSHDANGKRIELKDRKPKPIIYYLNADFPRELFDATQKIATDWNTAFSDAVAKVKSNCTIQEVNAYVASNNLSAEMKQAGLRYITDKNLDEACSKLAALAEKNRLSPRFFSGEASQINQTYGQLFQIRENSCNKKNVAAYVAEHNLSSELIRRGIPQSDDSSLIATCAFLERTSEQRQLQPRFEWQEIGDLRYSFLNYTKKSEISGPLGYGPSATDPITGEIINANANIYGAAIDVYAARGADIVQLLNGKVSAADIRSGLNVRRQFAVDDNEIASFSHVVDMRLKGQAGHKIIPLVSIDENLKVLRQSGFEDQYLMTDQILQGFAHDDNIDFARPSNWARTFIPIEGVFDQTHALNAMEHRVDFLGRRSACFLAETLEPAVIDLAHQMAGMSWEEAYQEIRSRILIAVAGHEIGHTFGLRHNFEASADPLNYFPNFWGVDTHDHRTTHMTNRGSEMRYSSIMDYHQRFNSDFAGIGLYDKAAIKFGYMGLVEVFDERDSEFVPKDWHASLNMFDYRDLPNLFSGSGVDGKINAHYDTVKSRFDRGDKTAHIDVRSLNLSAKPENLFKRRDVPFEQFYRSTALRLFGASNDSSEQYFEVPYKFCSDGQAFGGNMTCNRWDMGATAEEIVDNAAQMYESYYLFSAFRGDRSSLNPQGYMSQLYARTYQPMLLPFRYMYYFRNSSLRIWPIMRDWTAAAYKGLNFFGRVLQSVEPGRYCLNVADSYYTPYQDGQSCEQAVDIPLGLGKYYDIHWSPDFFYKPNNIGHVYDKLLALRALTESSAFFTRDFSVSLSRGAFSIGYYRVFGPELISLFSAIMRNDTAAYAPELVVENGAPNLKYRPLVSMQPEKSTGGVRIQPSNSWIMRYYALVFPMVNFTSSVDGQLDYAKRARITLVGARNDMVASDGLREAQFIDPITHLAYRGVVVEDAERSLGYLLVKDAQNFVNDGSNGEPAGPWFKAQSRLASAEERARQSVLLNTQDAQSVRSELVSAQMEMKNAKDKLYEKVHLLDVTLYLSEALDFSR